MSRDNSTGRRARLDEAGGGQDPRRGAAGYSKL